MIKNKSGIWSFLASVQLAIILLFLIAFFALIGTLVPQREAADAFAASISPKLFSFLQQLQLFDLYHSAWFFLLSGLLAVNLLICSLDRLPLAWRRYRTKPDPQNTGVFENLPEANRFSTYVDADTAAETAEKLLKKRYHGFHRVNTADGVFLAASRGEFSLFGVYVVHLSILLLIAGAIIGSIFGIEGYVSIIEGETVNEFHLRGSNQTTPLPFSVRCDRFIVEFYKNGMPKTFQSDLTILKNNRSLQSHKLRVNHPVEMEGFRFHQASYGAAPGGKATVALLRDGGRRDVLNVSEGYVFELPGREGTFQILRSEENLMNMGPALKVAVRSNKEEATFWIFQQIELIQKMNPDIIHQVPVFNPGLFHPYTFVLLGLEEKYYTGIQVTRDPGTPVVAAAAIMLIGGLMLVLFSYARQVWIRVERKKDQAHISIAARSYKNKTGLEREMQYLLAELKDNLENSK